MIIFAAVIIGVGFQADGANFAVTDTASADYEVFLGGKPLGVEIGTEGVIIQSVGNVVSDKGLVSPLKNSDVKSGDILLSINGEAVKTPADITRILNGLRTSKVTIKVKRGSSVFEEKLVAERDALTRERRLGISVKENITGVGTLTFIKNNKTFAALGHHITDPLTGLTEELNTGKIFDCSIVGVEKGTNGRAGELVGSFSKFDENIGVINKNNAFGIYGSYIGDTSGFSKIKVAEQSEIKHGKAYIYTTIDGSTPDYYSVDIIKTYQQNRPDTKSMVISVTDKRLIKATGGIVQGMSGSPIVQNGKLIGAVTHVFISDPTKGYGVYASWMLRQ